MVCRLVSIISEDSNVLVHLWVSKNLEVMMVTFRLEFKKGLEADQSNVFKKAFHKYSNYDEIVMERNSTSLNIVNDVTYLIRDKPNQSFLH